MSFNEASIVDLWGLPDKKVFIKMKDSFRTYFFNYAIKTAGNINRLGNSIGRKINNHFQEYKNGTCFTSLQLVKDILNTFPLERVPEFMSGIQENLEEIRMGWGNGKSIRNPMFPLKMSPILSRIIGHIIGDGGIRDRGEVYTLYYVNKCKFLTDQFKNDILQIFKNVELYEYIDKRDSTRSIILPSIFGLILKKFCGNQVGKFKHVPQTISNADKKSKSMFLRALFDDEGCISISSYQVIFEMTRKNVVKKVIEMLEEFCVKCGKIQKIIGKSSKHETAYRFTISGKRNFELFAKEIDFDHPKKKEKLRLLLKNYKRKKWGSKW